MEGTDPLEGTAEMEEMGPRYSVHFNDEFENLLIIRNALLQQKFIKNS